jgi:hypothetical protein
VLSIDSASRLSRTSCASLRLRIATGFLVALLATLGFADAASAGIIANLQPVSGASGIYSDTTSYSLADINAAGGIIIGDKLFDSFSVTSSASPNSIAPTAADIQVTAVDIDGDYGLKFNALWMASGGQWVDSTLVFHASLLPTAVAQGHGIVGNSLYFTGVAGANTTGGIASISENIYADHPARGESSFAEEFIYYMTPTNKSTQDSVEFAPVTDLWVVKDIGVSGGVGPNGVMHLSEFYQTFQQAPEPSTLVLSAVGLFGLAAFAWRKRRSV